MPAETPVHRSPIPATTPTPDPAPIVAHRTHAAMIAAVSHELRAPLSVILGYVHTLLDDDACDAKQSREYLRIVAASAEMLSLMISDLSDASHMDAGAFQIQPEPVQIERIAERVASTYRILAPLHRVSVEAPPGLPLGNADPLRVEQILSNLVQNAVKYSPADRDVTITIAAAEAITVSVSDAGPGIDPTLADRMFQPFVRAGGNLERRVRGTGMGLYVCRRLVEAHGGRIWVERGVTAGCSVSFTLPIVAHPIGDGMAVQPTGGRTHLVSAQRGPRYLDGRES
jgi:signal transduction histidine kinase